MAASSAEVIAPETVINPESSQATSSQPGAPTSRDDSAETMKIPEPIMAPMTSMVASRTPRSRSRAPGLAAGSVFAVLMDARPRRVGETGTENCSQDSSWEGEAPAEPVLSGARQEPRPPGTPLGTSLLRDAPRITPADRGRPGRRRSPGSGPAGASP